MMLRNINQRRDGKVIVYRPAVGVDGDLIPSTGTNGPSIIYPELTMPGDGAYEWSYWVEDAGNFPAGFWPLEDDGSAVRGPYSDGPYIGTVGLYRNDVRLYSYEVSMNVGTFVAPSITAQPVGQTVSDGQSATLSVSAIGTTPLAYQWRRNGVPISGAVAADYTFMPTVGDTAAIYTVVVSNIVGTVTSSTVSVGLTSTPTASSTSFEDGLEMILPYANGCPDVTAIFHLRRASIEFFQRTLAWKQRLATIDTVADQDVYSFGIPSQATIAKIIRYEFDGKEADVVDGTLGQSLTINQSSGEAIWTEDRVAFNVTPIPAEAGKKMAFQVALKPSHSATTIPTTMWEQYIQYLCLGALAGILDVPGQTFTDPGRAATYRSQFEAAINRTGAQASKSFSRARLSSRAHYF